jgi:hypothetical protein
METGDLVAFTANSRFGEWNKGDMARFDRFLVEYPLNQSSIAQLTLSETATAVWALLDEIRPHFEQLTLF